MKTRLLNVASKAICLLFLTSLSLASRAQNVSYKVVEDNPDIKNLFVSIHVADILAYTPNTGISYNIYANAYLGTKFQVDLDFKKAYSEDNATGVFAPEGLKKFSQLRLGGAYNLSSKTKTRDTRVVLSSTETAKYVHTKYIMVPAQHKVIWSARAGFQTFYHNCQVDNDPFKTYGANDIQYKDANGDLQYVDDNVNYETVNYTMRSTGIYAGIDYKNMVNLKVLPDGYKMKGTSHRNNFYLDALFTPVVTYELKPNSRQSQYNNVDINISENERSIFGWRFGWQYNMGKWAGFSFKAETGMQPGRPDEKWFVSAGLGLQFGGKIKGL